jgi:hypothetical protein
MTMTLKPLVWPGAMALLLAAACYNPKIEDAGLKCSAKSECPEGFTCNQGDGRCHKGGGGGGTGGSGGMGGTGGEAPDGADQICTTPMPPYGPFAGCAPKLDKATCDVVCQAGCKCGERCRLDRDGPACHDDQPPFISQYDRCDQLNDTCQPGLICLEELPNRPDCAAHCYRLCRNDAQCPMGSKCSDDVMVQGRVMAKSCSIPTEPCNPYGQARCGMPVQRPYPAFACYTVPLTPDLTACQCAGTIKTGTACENYFDCEPGAECVATGGQKLCRRVCLTSAAALEAGGCQVGQTCVPFVGGTKHGYCR